MTTLKHALLETFIRDDWLGGPIGKTKPREMKTMHENKNRGIARLSKHPREGKVPMGRREKKQSRRYRRARLPSKWWQDELAMEFGDNHSAYTRVVGGLF